MVCPLFAPDEFTTLHLTPTKTLLSSGIVYDAPEFADVAVVEDETEPEFNPFQLIAETDNTVQINSKNETIIVNIFFI